VEKDKDEIVEENSNQSMPLIQGIDGRKKKKLNLGPINKKKIGENGTMGTAQRGEKKGEKFKRGVNEKTLTHYGHL